MKKPLSAGAIKNGEAVLRSPRSDDRKVIQKIAANCGVFRVEELAATLERFEDAVAKGKSSAYDFLVAEQEGRVVGYACYGRVPLAEGSFLLHSLAIAADLHGQGLGLRLLEAVESQVLTAGGRILVAETSSQPS